MSEHKQPAARQDRQQATESQDQQQNQDRSTAEWVSFGIAATILLGVAGLVLFFWVSVPQGPAVLTVRPNDAIRQVGDQFYVPFVVGNGGGRTAASVQVSAELREAGQVVEAGTQEFNYLAGGEKQQGVFVFRNDPRTGEVLLRIVGYKEP